MVGSKTENRDMTTAPNKQMTPLQWATLGLMSFCWGCAFFFNEFAVTAFPPFTVVFIRVVIGGAALLLIMHATGKKMVYSKPFWKICFVVGFCNCAITFTVIVWGQIYI